MEVPAVAVAEGRPGPLRDVVHAALFEAILSGEFGVAERLTEPKLATRFGVSRTPVREAVTRLVADGLLRREDYGYSVVVPDLTTIRDLWEVRIAVELRGIDRCVENPDVRHDAELLGEELQRWYRMRADPPPPEPEFVLEDERFHTTLLTASGNVELVAVLDDVTRRIRRIRMFDYIVPGRVEAAVTEHVQIAEQVLDGRLDTARRLLHEHMGASLEVVMERAARALVAMNAQPGLAHGRTP